MKTTSSEPRDDGDFDPAIDNPYTDYRNTGDARFDELTKLLDEEEALKPALRRSG